MEIEVTDPLHEAMPESLRLGWGCASGMGASGADEGWHGMYTVSTLTREVRCL
jgi:hypothetical protein